MSPSLTSGTKFSLECHVFLMKFLSFTLLLTFPWVVILKNVMHSVNIYRNLVCVRHYVGCHGELKEKNEQNYGEALPVYGCLVCSSAFSDLPVVSRTWGPQTLPHTKCNRFFGLLIHSLLSDPYLTNISMFVKRLIDVNYRVRKRL